MPRARKKSTSATRLVALTEVASSAPPARPLRTRLRNPPPIFVGRCDEAKRLAEAIARAPATIVWGLGGIGKTALALHVLHASFPERVERTICVGVRPGDRSEELLVGVVSAIEAARGGGEGASSSSSRSSWSGALGDRDALVATAIDLADEADVWVLIDDLHHADPAIAAALLHGVAVYARRARFVVTSRVDPAIADLREQTIALGAMPTSELEALARALSPSTDRASIARVLRDAAGSPWRLRQLLTGADPEERDPLRGLSPRARALVRTLATLDVPLHVQTLRAAVDAPEPQELVDLERRGWIESSDAGVRLHDVARAMIGVGVESGAEAETTRGVAKALATSDDPSARLEAVRLLAAMGDADAVVDAVARSAAAWIEAGHAPRLWQIVEPLDDPRLEEAKLACAAELGGGPALAWAVGRPRPSTVAARGSWLRALHLARKLEEAAKESALLADEIAAADPALAFETRLLEVRALLLLGRPAEAAAVLDRLSPPDVDAAVVRDVERARVTSMLGDYSAAVHLCEPLRTAVLRVHPARRPVVELELARVTGNLGRYGWTAELIAHAEAAMAGTPASVLRTRRIMIMRSLLAVEAGHLDEARALLQRCDTYGTDDAAMNDLTRRMNTMRLRAAEGKLEGLAREIESMRADALAMGNVDMYAWATLGRLYVAALFATPGVGLDWSPKVPFPAGPQGPYLLAFERMLRARRGEQVPDDEGVALPDIIDVQLAVHLSRASIAWLAGDAEKGIAHAHKTLALAREHGWAIYEAEALGVRAEIELVLDRDAALRETARELGALGTRFPSPRYASDARFFEAAAERVPDPAVLAELAALAEVAPPVARRSRALLGASARLDAADRAVVEAIRRRAGTATLRSLRAHGERAWRAGWSLDAYRRCARVGAGRALDLSDQPVLWRLLDAIARNGGACSKEDLARAAWGIASYHPLRDDKRMQVAVRRLRLALEDDPSRPTRIVTLDDGYGFGDEPVRVLTIEP